MLLPLREAVEIGHPSAQIRVFLEGFTRLFQGVTPIQRHLNPLLKRIVFPHFEFPIRSFAHDHEMIACHLPRHPFFNLRLDGIVIPKSSLDLFQAIVSKQLFWLRNQGFPAVCPFVKCFLYLH